MEEANYPPALRHEAAIVADSAGVKEGSVFIDNAPESAHLSIRFTLETEAMVDPSEVDIRSEESIELRYSDLNAVGVSAPSIWCLREDFPRNLGHLNPVSSDSPVSLCLARSGLQPIYDRYGVEGVLHRLRTWMRDAQTDSLMSDGWEPVPYGQHMDFRAGLLTAKEFQEIALCNGDKTNWTTGLAKITTPEHGNTVLIYSTEISATTPSHNSLLAQQVYASTDADGKRDGVPWIFVWSSQNSPQDAPTFGVWDKFKDMKEGLRSIGLEQVLLTALGHVFGNNCECSHYPEGRKTVVILVGIWRPVALLGNIYDLSNDKSARHLEIKAFTLETDRHHNPSEDDAKVRAIIANPWPCADLFQWTSGINDAGAVALVGYGALGSAIADHLLRIGSKEITVIDHDKLAPHNLARHQADHRSDLYRAKVRHFKRKANSISFPGAEINTQALNENILTLDHNNLANHIATSKLIIDATADERVRRHLSEFSKNDSRQLIRTEIYHQGRLGVQFVTGPRGNPNLLDLYYSLCVEALTNDSIHLWLRDEYVKGQDNEELLFGFGCTSRTTRMPNFIVTQHASAFMPTIIDGAQREIPTGIGVNTLDENSRPMGWHWIDSPVFHLYEPEGAPEWSVHLHPEVLSFLDSERTKALPNETGGYLYGGCDLALKQITIVKASPLPSESSATGVSLTLGPAGSTPIEQHIARRTKNRIFLCGTWHSHPNHSSTMSEKDRATYRSCVEEDWKQGVPTLLLIIAEDIVSAYLRA